MSNSPPTFNLWSAPWLTVERPSGQLDTLSIEQTLAEAHLIHALYDPSPLVVVGIHRLLVAVLQTAYAPQSTSDLVQIWREGHFLPDKIASFGAQYAGRFDLFAAEVPFYQSADLPLYPAKGDKTKPVGYLLEEQPAGTAVTHYNHSYDDALVLCSSCAAKGLLVMPAFASSGGAGIKPSINGVPPMYVLPGGETLFQSLTASLTISEFQPPNFEAGQPLKGGVWWERPAPTVVEKKGEVRRVSYLHSLTFPARRIRLHPVPMLQPCTRCGEQTAWGTQAMVYEMGEDHVSSIWWRDPFAAFRAPKNEQEAPLPIRPFERRALWREFRGLFLPHEKDSEGAQTFRPAIINQIWAVWSRDKRILPYEKIPFRVIGLRTDMKMKIFEWEETGFLVAPRLLDDPKTAEKIQAGIDFAADADSILKKTFRVHFGGDGKAERYATLKRQMSVQYWQQLGQKFQTSLMAYANSDDSNKVFHTWLDTVLQEARNIFDETIEALPGDGPTLHKRQVAISDCRKNLFGYRKKNYPKPTEESHDPHK